MVDADSPTRRDIDGGWATRTNSRLALLAGAVLLSLYLCYLMARPFLPAVVWSLTLAAVTRGFWLRLGDYIGRPNVRAGLAVAAVAILFLAPIVSLVYFSAAEVAETIALWQSPDYRASIREKFGSNSWLSEAWAEISDAVDLATVLQQGIQWVQGSVTGVFSGLAYTVAQALLTLFILFFLYRDDETVLSAAKRYSPLSPAETEGLLARLNDTVHATVYGSLVVALVQGALGGLIFWLLGIPAAVFWGIVMGILSMIPYLGSFVVWGPTAAYLALTGELVKVGILVGWGTCAIGLVDNLLYPTLVGNRLRQHTVITFMAIIGGLSVFGTTGIILGPVIVSLTFALMEVWRQRTDATAAGSQGD